MTIGAAAATPAPPRDSRQLWACIALSLPVALALRIWLAARIPGVARPDEIFQTLEPAHRLWSGWGFLTWEWHAGIRSWLFPDVLAGLMALSARLGLDAAGYLLVIAATLSVLSLGVVVVAITLGWRHSGMSGAVLCGTLCTCWPSLVYFAPKPLTEVQAGNILVVAAGLACVLPRGNEAAARRRRALLCGAIGVLLGLAVCLRFHLAPGILLVAVWAARRDGRAGWLPLLAGAALPLVLQGVSDAASWGIPLQSIWKNFLYNFLVSGSDGYGVAPFHWYIGKVVESWGAAVLPVLVFFCIGARASPMMALLAGVIVLSHSIIRHKEISFIYAALPPVLIVAGIGTSRVVEALPLLLRPAVSPRLLLAGAVGLWVSVAALSGDAALHVASDDALGGVLPVWIEAGRRPDLCGLGLYRVPWSMSGGYTYLDRPVPIYSVQTPEALAAARPALNYLVIDRALLGIGAPGYDEVKCSRHYCLVRRDQACTGIGDIEMPPALQRLGP